MSSEEVNEINNEEATEIITNVINEEATKETNNEEINEEVSQPKEEETIAIAKAKPKAVPKKLARTVKLVELVECWRLSEENVTQEFKKYSPLLLQGPTNRNIASKSSKGKLWD